MASVRRYTDPIAARANGETMENRSIVEPTAEHRRLLRLLLQVLGVTDIALGAALAVLGPGIVGGDPVVDTVLMVGGGILALGGLAMIWFARRRFGVKGDGEGSGLVVRRER